jgi:type III restriction enzyme
LKVSDTETWIVETKGREDLNDPRKWERLKQWCEDATATDAGRTYKALFVDEDDWKRYRVNSFAEARATYRTGESN